MTAPKSALVHIRLPAAERAELERRAAEDDRSLSSFLRLLIRAALQQQSPAKRRGRPPTP